MKSLNTDDEQNSSEPRRFRVLRIIAGLAVAALAVVLAQRYLMPPLTVERIDDAERGFQTLLAGNDQAWLFRYRGGLMDCWLEEDRDNSVNIIQTVAISQELKVPFEVDRSFRYGLIFIKESSRDAQQVLEVSHWAVFGHNPPSTLIGQKTLVTIPRGQAAFGVYGTEGRRATPETLMSWSISETNDGPRREVRLMCGKPKAVIVRGQGY